MLSLCASQVANQVSSYVSFGSMKKLGVFHLPSWDGMLVRRRVTPPPPPQDYPDTNLFT